MVRVVARRRRVELPQTSAVGDTRPRSEVAACVEGGGLRDGRERAEESAAGRNAWIQLADALQMDGGRERVRGGGVVGVQCSQREGLRTGRGVGQREQAVVAGVEDRASAGVCCNRRWQTPGQWGLQLAAPILCTKPQAQSPTGPPNQVFSSSELQRCAIFHLFLPIPPILA